MVSLHPQYITDTAGEQLVVLPVAEFNSIIEELEDLEDIRLYDKAKQDGDNEKIAFTDYLKERNKRG